MQVDHQLADFAKRLSALIADAGHFLPGQGQQSVSWSDDRFNALAVELFTLQYRCNVPYRQFCTSHDASPHTVRHWTEIPCVPTAAFKEREFSCLAPENRSAVFYSSGTTQQRPSRHYHNAESLALYETALWPWFASNVLPDRPSPLRFLALTPGPDAAPHSSLVHMFDTIRRHLEHCSSRRQEAGVGTESSRQASSVRPLRQLSPAFVGRTMADSAWELDWAAATAAFEMADTVGPLLLLGTAFSFVHLLDLLAEHELRFDLPAGSRVMETGGYKGRSRAVPKAELHALITERLGVPPGQIVSEFGMSELSSQAYSHATTSAQGPHQILNAGTTPFMFPAWTRTQVISPETGKEVTEDEAGLLRIFDLANAYSVQALQTEDLAVRRGNGFELLGRAAMAEPRGCSLMAAD